MKNLCAAFCITSLSPAVTKLQTVSTNQTKIASSSFDKVLKAVVPVNINVSLSVIDILKIQEVDHIYILKFRLVLEWYTKFL